MKINNYMKYISILLSLILLTILFSCNKDETVTPDNTSTQNQTNTFIGSTSTFDYLYSDSNQNANIEVKAFGVNDQVIQTAITDSNGKFQMDNLPVGTFDFEFTKPGWSKYTQMSVYNQTGPKPTKFNFTNGNIYSNKPYPIVRNIYSEITNLTLDSFKNQYSSISGYYHFTAIINKDIRDNLEKANINIISHFTYDDAVNAFFYHTDSVRFIPPNKIYIRSFAQDSWGPNPQKIVKLIISGTKDLVQDLVLLNPNEYTNTFKSEGGIKMKTFTITKP